MVYDLKDDEKIFKKAPPSWHISFSRAEQSRCCQFSDFSDPLSNFISKKQLATNLATYSDHQGKGEEYIIL